MIKKSRIGLALWAAFFAMGAEAADLQEVDYSVLPGDKVQIRLKMSEPVALPTAFVTDSPARIALDFPGLHNKLAKKSRDIGVGVARNLTAIEAQGRTRVVLGLVQSTPYDAQIDGNDVVITLGTAKSTPLAATVKAGSASSSALKSGSAVAAKGIATVDFRRGEQGEGRVLVSLSNSSITPDLKQEGKKIIVDFPGADIDTRLVRRLDVVDFATPVRTVEFVRRNAGVRLVIDTLSDFEHLAFQTNNVFTVELKPLTAEEQQKKAEQRFQFTGQKMSLNFQDIEVRAVLQLIADLTQLNLIASDNVRGNITLRLQDVPWDQALDIILKTKGLDKRQTGNVLLVAPAEELAKQEQTVLESSEKIKELAPLRSEYIRINYAKASDMAKLIKDGNNSLMSSRGHVSVDERTNTLLIQDTSEKLEEVRGLLANLDVAVRQVMIESRIVLANSSFSESLGVRFGASDRGSNNGVAGSLTGASQLSLGGGIPTINDRLNVNLPAQNATGSIGLNIGHLADGTILDLELSASEKEGESEIVGSPRLITANQKEAYIETGTEIPYSSSAANGNTTIEFKKAVLSLQVTPQITPDDRIILDLVVNQDTPGITVQSGNNTALAINTQEVGTQVLVNNGETIVLGGIFKGNQSLSENKVPVLGDLPGVGWMFRNKATSTTKEELLIFVTPKIIQDKKSE